MKTNTLILLIELTISSAIGFALGYGLACLF